ncbi:MAG: GNAT family N-acetyltransferase [bacterium]
MTELIVRKAEAEEYESVMDFYRSMTDRRKERGLTITWVRDVNPSPAFIKQSIEEGSLYTGRLGERIVSAMVLNHRHAPQYKNAAWALPLCEKEYFVIHSLGTDPDFAGKGIGDCMIREAAARAREMGAKALRLDVLDTNEPAKRLYLRCGFTFRGESQLYYENTGWRTFEMHELLLQEEKMEEEGRSQL